MTIHRSPIVNILNLTAFRCLVLICALAPLLNALLPGPVRALENQPYVVLQTNPLTFDDGPSGTEMICACYTDRDLIRVVRLEGDADISADLTAESDFDGTLWLFDTGLRGRYQIGVRFLRVEGQLIARLYQDQDEDGYLRIEGSDDRPVITEPGTWAIQITALDGFWQRDSRISLNFDMLIDDRMYAAFGANNYAQYMTNDSVIDTTIKVRGPTETDPRSIDWRNATPPVPESEGILRTTLMVRESGEEPAISPIFPWLFLGYATDTPEEALLDPKAPKPETVLEPRDSINPQFSGFDHPYGENAPPIQVDWTLGRTAGIGEVITSRWGDNNWFTYSINRVEPETTTNPNFESPFAYYDLAGDKDGLPELMVRIERLNKDDFTIANTEWQGKDIQKIRYVWDQSNTQAWSYKLGLLGQHEIDQTVPFSNFTLQTVPYDTFPEWVVDNNWDLATFVAAESPIWTTEGIYDWDPSGHIRDQYYAGVSTETYGTFEHINPGLRGEYRLDLNDQPWLTFNPIDSRLHLFRAERGMWQIDESRWIEYGTSDRTYFDSWTLRDGDEIIQQLYRVPGGLLFSSSRGTYFKQVDIPSETFRTLPPTTTAEWAELGTLLEANKLESEPGDLRAYFDQFEGETNRIADEQAIDVRRLDDGAVSFSFAAARGQEHAELATLTGGTVEPGPVMVTISQSGWQTAPGIYRNPVISVEISDVVEKTQVEGELTITNPGTFDITGTQLNVTVIAPGAEGFEMSDYILNFTLAGGETLVLPINWTPRGTGPRDLTVTIERTVQNMHDPIPVVVATHRETVDALPLQPLPLRDSVTLGTVSSAWQRIAGIALLSVIAGTTALFVLHAKGNSG